MTMRAIAAFGEPIDQAVTDFAAGAGDEHNWFTHAANYSCGRNRRQFCLQNQTRLASHSSKFMRSPPVHWLLATLFCRLDAQLTVRHSTPLHRRDHARGLLPYRRPEIR